MVLLFIGLLTLFRLVYAANSGMTNDETYYWQWSRHLAPAYYDQGPGIAFCIRLGTLLFGDTPLGVRAVPILLAALTGWLIFDTARRWFDARIALWSLGLLSVAPLLAVGGLLATYDNPQVCCWAGALWCLTRTVQDDRPALWYGVGLFTGLGLLCKLTMILFAPCALVFLLLVPTYRKHLATPHPWLAFVLALLIWSPALAWNATHDWPMFRHASALSSRGHGLPPLRLFGDFLGSQAVVVSPFLFLAELYALGRLAIRLRRAPELSDGERFTFAFGAPVLLLCFGIALRSKMEANWPAPTHLAGLIALAALFAGAWKQGRIQPRIGVAVSAGLSALMVALLLFPGIAPALGLRVSADLAQKANETYGWPEVMAGVQAARRQLEAEGKSVFVAGVNYRVPSLLAFYLPDHPETAELFFATRHDQYWYWTRPETLVGQNAVLCVDDDKDEVVPLARRYFESVETLPNVLITRPGFTGPVKNWRVHLCRNFKGYDPVTHIEGW